jgi:hypothetical protein
MRAQVDFLDTNQMEWASHRPGTFNKLLSRNPETTARTALIRSSPAAGHQAQPKPHAHTGTEEIFISSGMLSFDSRSWLHPGAYVYHPADYVHGFASNVPQETIFVSRISTDLTFRYFDEPEDDHPYFVGQTAASRPLAIVASPWATPWARLDGADGDVRQFDYSRDPQNRELSALRRYAPGARDPDAGTVPAGYVEEIFVQEGEVEDQHGRLFTPGCFASLLEGSASPRFHARTPALVYRSLFKG